MVHSIRIEATTLHRLIIASRRRQGKRHVNPTSANEALQGTQDIDEEATQDIEEEEDAKL